MVDFLPAKFVDPSRAELAADWRRDVSIRNPGADVGPGSQPWLDSWVATDTILPLYTYAQDTSNKTNWIDASGADLDVWLQANGTQRLPAIGAIGAITIATSSAGTVLQAGDQGTCNGFTYKVVRGGYYGNGAQVVIMGVDTGPQTDQPAGAAFRFKFARPGCSPDATVVMQPDGTGLTGGSNIETDDQAKLRLQRIKSSPAGAGNDAHIWSIVSQTPGMSVQAVFTYPAILGPGTTAVTFTLRPPSSGASRLPNEAQLTIALGYLQGAGSGQLPASDSIFMCALLASPLAMVLKAVWAQGSPGWADATPFPLYQSPGNNWAVTSAVTPTPTTFNIQSATDTAAPQVGQSVGVFNAATQAFARKKILSVSGSTGNYTLTVDPSGGVSDLTYAPLVGQLVCPWSDSLNSVVAPVLAYFDSVGPGEQVGAFFDPGLRQRRSPPSPAQWSSQVSNRMIGGPPNAAQPFDPNAAATPTLLSTAQLADVELIEPVVPYQTPVGIPGVASYLLMISSLAVFPE